MVIPRPQHTLSRSNISGNALKVLYRLKSCGHQAFLVGGGVRDLLVGRSPDFDVATDARPEQVRNFSQLPSDRAAFPAGACALRPGGDRGGHISVLAKRCGGDREHPTAADPPGQCLGTIDEDVWRRDFTVNALYYNIADFSIWDYSSGMEDVSHRTLRLIGEPVARYREDPVRMLRAARLSAKLGFSIAKRTARPIEELAELLREVPAARLYDETLKLLHAGTRSQPQHCGSSACSNTFPAHGPSLGTDENGLVHKFIQAGLDNTDRRVKERKPVTPMFLFAVLLWFPIRESAEQIRREDDCSEVEAFLEACDEVLGEQLEHTAFPRRFSAPMKEMLLMQRRFHFRRGARARRLLQHRLFRAAYDFLVLRAECGDADPELARWWTDVQTFTPEEQHDAFAVKRQRRSRRRRRASRRPPAGKPGDGKTG